MLVVTRRRREEVVILLPDGNEIRVILLETGTGSAQLGIQAPSDIPVHRGEVWRRIQDEKEAG